MILQIFVASIANSEIFQQLSCEIAEKTHKVIGSQQASHQTDTS
jgi:hypothetical protein